jgi:hypothetical protein
MKLGAAIAAAVALTALAADKPPSVGTLLANAKAEAAHGNRAIWLIFDASW